MLEDKRKAAMRWVLEQKAKGIGSLDLGLYELLIPEMSEGELEQMKKSLTIK